ncbi:hypothetical protein CYPRO_0129 [Cyclonatronum proteinivorum]|uniref:Uncharacterized protein n=1 Tax=Cyclonatronum proteinivorum TaxID=1457365 RepID=A0A345UG15_9BACT|nr:hypothetical protein CYPRO_0129 [Cyclonatronum proteinivorum]
MSFELVLASVLIIAAASLFFLLIRKIRVLTIPRAFGCYRALRCETTRVSRNKAMRYLDYVLPTKRYYCKTCNQSFTRIVP